MNEENSTSETGFKCDVNLFFEGVNNADIAKSSVTSTIATANSMTDIEGMGAVIAELNNCNVDSLIAEITAARDRLLQLDDEFAQQYFKLLQGFIKGLDPETIGEDYITQYELYEKEYWNTLATMLEKNEDTLSEDMKRQLEIARAMADYYSATDEKGADDAKGVLLTLLSGFSPTDNIDYTFDPSNVGISIEELYSKAGTIRNANIPPGIKIVQMAKLLHEYTLGWTWSGENLVYNKGFEGTLETPSKLICCATGVSDVLWLAGFVDTIENQAGQFNPNYQQNIKVTAEKKGWQKITIDNFDKLQPGDIVLTSYNGSIYEHVEIYAGNGYAYSWGSTKDIGKEGPKSVTIDEYKASHACAYRVITTETI